MRKTMTIRFFNWIAERHKIYVKRNAGEPWPWTTDPILHKYKFTNVFRQLDRETVELGRRLREGSGQPMEDLFFNIILFRMFNWHETYDALGGWCSEWHGAPAKRILRQRKKEGKKIITGAYIITNMGRSTFKGDMLCDSLTKIWRTRQRDMSIIMNSRSIEYAVGYMARHYDMVGRFVAYEFATDMRHTKILGKATDIMSWANPGPGCKRGLNRIKGRELRYKPSIDVCNKEMHILLDMQDEHLPMFVPSLEMRDVEHSLCEFDKYERVRRGEGRPRSKYRGPKQ